MANWSKTAPTIWSAAYNQVAADYQVVGAGSTISKSVAQFKNGNSSLLVNVNRGSATNTDINTLHAVTPSVVSTGRIGVWVYISNYTLLTNIVLKISHGDATFTNGAFQAYTFADADKQYNGWHFVAFDLAEFTGAYGTPNWAATVSFIRVTITQNSATATTVYIDSIVHSWDAKGKVIITNDDGWASWFTSGIPVLDARNLKSTASIIAAHVDLNPSWVTSAQLAAAYNSGHDLCVHGATAMSGLADTQARINDVKSNKDFLDNAGYSRGTDVYVWPNGVYQLSAGDQECINVLKAQGFVCARGTTSVRYYRHSVGQADNRWLIPIIGVDHLTTPATIAGYLDIAATRGVTCVLMYHEIVASGASAGTQRNLSDFTADMDAVKTRVDAGTLDCVTFNEWAANTGLSDAPQSESSGLTSSGLTRSGLCN